MIRVFLMSFVVAGTAHAQAVNECNWIASSEYIVQPQSQNVREFANGNVRVTHIDTDGEPACCSSFIMVTIEKSEQGRVCRLISNQHTNMSGVVGFGKVMFSETGADYDPEYGLFVETPVKTMGGDGLLSNEMMIQILINQATGDITASVMGD